MRKNAYKDILDFLIEVSQIEAQSHHLCRLQTMAGLVHMHIDLLDMLLPSIPHNCRAVLLGQD